MPFLIKKSGWCGAVIAVVLVGMSPHAWAQCSQLSGMITQLNGQIARESNQRDAANLDRMALSNYQGAYNRLCSGGDAGSGNLGGGSRAGAAIGALGNLAGVLSDIQAERDAKAAQASLREARQQFEAIRQAEIERQQRRQAAAADDMRRQGLNNPFASGGASDDPSNPFAAPRPSAPPARVASINTANPFAPAAQIPRPVAKGGFMTDQQISDYCAKSANPGMCQLAEQQERSTSPAYQKALADQQKQRDQKLAAAQAQVAKAFADFDQQRAQADAAAAAARAAPASNPGSIPLVNATLQDNGSMASNTFTLAPTAKDDGLECGTGGGRRSSGVCLQPWDGDPDECAQAFPNFVSYEKSSDGIHGFCATSSEAHGPRLQTAVGEYDLGAKGAAKPEEGPRERIRRQLEAAIAKRKAAAQSSGDAPDATDAPSPQPVADAAAAVSPALIAHPEPPADLSDKDYCERVLKGEYHGTTIATYGATTSKEVGACQTIWITEEDIRKLMKPPPLGPPNPAALSGK